jgi:hypothetical protein
MDVPCLLGFTDDYQALICYLPFDIHMTVLRFHFPYFLCPLLLSLNLGLAQAKLHLKISLNAKAQPDR